MNSESMKDISLKVLLNGKVIFQSDEHWLLPLFDLEDHLREHPVNMALTEVHDKVIGKAAALLILRLGAGSVHGEVMSELADAVLRQAGISHTFNQMVKRIDCQTEELLLAIDDMDAAYEILCKRANRC